MRPRLRPRSHERPSSHRPSRPRRRAHFCRECSRDTVKSHERAALREAGGEAIGSPVTNAMLSSLFAERLVDAVAAAKTSSSWGTEWRVTANAMSSFRRKQFVCSLASLGSACCRVKN